MQKSITGAVKDIISFFVYVLVCPFFRNKNAVLVYHAVDGEIDSLSDPYKINIKPALFKMHMAYVAKRKERFRVTFDDGYGSLYRNAFPVVREYGIKSTLFLTTEYIDGKVAFGHFFDDKCLPAPLTWSEIKQIKDAGVELGSHSLTHTNITGLNDEKIYSEAFFSKKRIEDMTGHSVTSFSYPFGNAASFNERTEKNLKQAGYKRAYVNVMSMDNSKIDPFKIGRIRIYSTDSMFRFKMKTAGAYNWVDLLVKSVPLKKSYSSPPPPSA